MTAPRLETAWLVLTRLRSAKAPWTVLTQDGEPWLTPREENAREAVRCEWDCGEICDFRIVHAAPPIWHLDRLNRTCRYVRPSCLPRSERDTVCGYLVLGPGYPGTDEGGLWGVTAFGGFPVSFETEEDAISAGYALGMRAEVWPVLSGLARPMEARRDWGARCVA